MASIVNDAHGTILPDFFPKFIIPKLFGSSRRQFILLNRSRKRATKTNPVIPQSSGTCGACLRVLAHTRRALPYRILHPGRVYLRVVPRAAFKGEKKKEAAMLQKIFSERIGNISFKPSYLSVNGSEAVQKITENIMKIRNQQNSWSNLKNASPLLRRTLTAATAMLTSLFTADAQVLSDTFVDGSLEVKYFIDFHQNKPVTGAEDFDVRLINDRPGMLTASGSFTLQGGGLELGNSLATSSTPFVDFHFQSGRDEDFNVRLINDADRWLVVRGGSFAVEGTLRTTTLELTSDVNKKTNFAPVDTSSILGKLEQLPITTWSYTNAPAIRHMGPTAQDFHSAFGLANDPTHISAVDGIGVALAAIKALSQEVRDQRNTIAELQRAMHVQSK